MASLQHGFDNLWMAWFLNYGCYLSFPALLFDPDRFLDSRVQKYLTPNPFIFLPFNAGPRICLGQQVSFAAYLLIAT